MQCCDNFKDTSSEVFVGPEENPIEKDRKRKISAAKREVREVDEGTLECCNDIFG